MTMIFPKFSEVFPDDAAFKGYLDAFDLVMTEYKEIYAHLLLRFEDSTFRYATYEKSASKLMRILAVEYPYYKQKKDALTELYQLDLAKFQDGGLQVMNLASNPNEEPPTDSAEPLPYTAQQTVSTIKMSEVDAIMKKYRAAFRDPIDTLVKACENLFRGIYEEEEDIYL
ncbi:MAG: hypothetical protein GX132_01435 [Erysipelotrichia bacterium]|nr:hypothetical protein [Erysipelotrichia bacterium]